MKLGCKAQHREPTLRTWGDSASEIKEVNQPDELNLVPVRPRHFLDAITPSEGP